MSVDVATPVWDETTLCEVTTELTTPPFAAVEKEVNVTGTVEDAYRPDVTTMFEVSVDRLIVEDPTTTISEVGELLTFDREVTVEPALFVVVTATVLGDADVGCCWDVVCCSDVDASEVEEGVVSEVVVGVSAAVVGVVAVVGAADVVPSDWVGVDTEVDVVAVEEAAEIDDIVDDGSVVEDASLVDVVTPVPTTCRLGMMPSGMLSALICEKKRENMMAKIMQQPFPIKVAKILLEIAQSCRAHTVLHSGLFRRQNKMLVEMSIPGRKICGRK